MPSSRHAPQETPDICMGLCEIHPGLVLVSLRTPTIPPATHTSCFLFGRSSFLAVDPGATSSGEQARLDRLIEARTQKGGRLLAVLLTHHHLDHMGGADHLQRRFQVPVLAHRETLDRLNGRFAGQRCLEDGETISADEDSLVAILTPGHAPGHLCFLDQARGALLVGDMMAGSGTIVIDPPEGNLADYLDSLRRIRGLEPSLLLPAHGPPMPDAIAKIDAYLRHREMRTRQILHAIEAGAHSVGAIARRVYADMPLLVQWMGRRSVLAHLEMLEGEGRVVREGTRYRLP